MRTFPLVSGRGRGAWAGACVGSAGVSTAGSSAAGEVGAAGVAGAGVPGRTTGTGAVSSGETTGRITTGVESGAGGVSRTGPDDGVRMVPGGSSVRRGAHVARGVVVMPPAFVNVGAFVGEGTMVDSHALVGSCAQIGRRVHLSAGAQVGGVLEPVNARPVIVEDEVFVGALCGLFEGVVVRERAVLASGVILTASTVVFDLVQEREWTREIPAGAVVVPGVRPARGAFAVSRGIGLSAPCIVKYRDARTDAATALESALRG